MAAISSAIAESSPGELSGGQVHYIYFYRVDAPFDADVYITVAYGLISDAVIPAQSATGAFATIYFQTLDGTISDSVNTCYTCSGKKQYFGNIVAHVQTNVAYQVELVAGEGSDSQGGAGLAWADPAISIDQSQYPGASIEVSSGAGNTIDLSTVAQAYIDAGLPQPSDNATDGPLPPWTIFALMASVIGIGMRRVRQPRTSD